MYSFALVLLHAPYNIRRSFHLAPHISPDIALLRASETQLASIAELLRRITNQQISSSVPSVAT